MSEDLSVDAYALLGVSVLATDDEIHRAYRAIARRMHPDTNPDPDAAAAFARVTSAYELLHDPARRRAYDLGRAVQRGPRATRAAPGPTGNAAVRGPHARPSHRPIESPPPPSERPVSDTDEFALLGIIVKIVAVIIVLLLLGVIFLSITARCDNGLDIADACKLPTPTATSDG